MTTTKVTALYPESTLSELFTKFTGQEPKQSFGPEKMFLCPEHNDTEPSLAINDNKDVGFCHSIACGWKFNRHQLCKWAGALPDRSGGVISYKQMDYIGNKSPSEADRVADALCGSPQLWEKGNSVRNCHTMIRRLRCLDCGTEFEEAEWGTNSCQSVLCPKCRPKQVRRFIDTHRKLVTFYKAPQGLTVKFPGKVLANMGHDPVAALQSIISDAERMLARFTRKIPVCRSHLRTVQVTLKDGIAWVKLSILFDGTNKEAELLKMYFNERLHWATANLSRPLRDTDDALAWFESKAARPLEFGSGYPTARDIEVFVYATTGKRLIQGAGRFYRVSGGKGFDAASREARRAVAAEAPGPRCPKCGSTRAIRIGIRLVKNRSPAEEDALQSKSGGIKAVA